MGDLLFALSHNGTVRGLMRAVSVPAFVAIVMWLQYKMAAPKQDLDDDVGGARKPH